jgi:hypothetical protein
MVCAADKLASNNFLYTYPRGRGARGDGDSLILRTP